MCFQKQTTEVECHLFPSLQCTYYYHLKVHTINLISLRLLILITWLRYCLSSFCFVVIIFSPFSKCSLWKETTVPGRHLQRGNLCPIFFKLSMYIIYLEYCKWILLILPHLFVYSIICLYKCRHRDMYFILRIIIQYYVISFVKTASGLAFEGSFCWLQVSLVAQLVKTLPAVQETQVRILGLKDPLEKEMATTPVILPGVSLWHIPVSVFMCVCVCVYYLFSDTTNAPGSSCIFSAPFINSLKSLGSFHWRIILGWPKSLFWFSITSHERSEWTFWWIQK